MRSLGSARGAGLRSSRGLGSSRADTENFGVPYVAHSAYEAADEGELSLEPGDVVFVREFDDSGWWEGRSQRTGEEGWLPSTFVVSLGVEADQGHRPSVCLRVAASRHRSNAACHGRRRRLGAARIPSRDARRTVGAAIHASTRPQRGLNTELCAASLIYAWRGLQPLSKERVQHGSTAFREQRADARLATESSGQTHDWQAARLVPHTSSLESLEQAENLEVVIGQRDVRGCLSCLRAQRHARGAALVHGIVARPAPKKHCKPWQQLTAFVAAA